VGENVEGEGREVLEAVDDEGDEVVVRLDLAEDDGEDDDGVGVDGLGESLPDVLGVVLSKALQGGPGFEAGQDLGLYAKQRLGGGGDARAKKSRGRNGRALEGLNKVRTKGRKERRKEGKTLLEKGERRKRR